MCNKLVIKVKKHSQKRIICESFFLLIIGSLILYIALDYNNLYATNQNATKVIGDDGNEVKKCVVNQKMTDDCHCDHTTVDKSNEKYCVESPVSFCDPQAYDDDKKECHACENKGFVPNKLGECYCQDNKTIVKNAGKLNCVENPIEYCRTLKEGNLAYDSANNQCERCKNGYVANSEGKCHCNENKSEVDLNGVKYCRDDPIEFCAQELNGKLAYISARKRCEVCNDGFEPNNKGICDCPKNKTIVNHAGRGNCVQNPIEYCSNLEKDKLAYDAVNQECKLCLNGYEPNSEGICHCDLHKIELSFDNQIYCVTDGVSFCANLQSGPQEYDRKGNTCRQCPQGQEVSTNGECQCIKFHVSVKINGVQHCTENVVEFCKQALGGPLGFDPVTNTCITCPDNNAPDQNGVCKCKSPLHALHTDNGIDCVKDPKAFCANISMIYDAANRRCVECASNQKFDAKASKCVEVDVSGNREAKKSSLGIIIGAVVGGIVALILIAIVVIISIRRIKRSSSSNISSVHRFDKSETMNLQQQQQHQGSSLLTTVGRMNDDQNVVNNYHSM